MLLCEYVKLIKIFLLLVICSELFGFVCIIVVIGGKGGVGKINVLVNLVVVLVGMGKCMLLLDVDFGLVNIDVILGLNFIFMLVDLVVGCCLLDDVIVEGLNGVLVVLVVFGCWYMVELVLVEYVGLVNVFFELECELDIMVVDIVVGIIDGVLIFCQVVQDIVVVVCDELVLIIDVYVLIKVLLCEWGVDCIQVVVNMVCDFNEGCVLYEKLICVCEKFFVDVLLNYLGCVLQDDWLCLLVQCQQLVVKVYLFSLFVLVIIEIVCCMVCWQVLIELCGGVEFFFECIFKQCGVVV